MAAPRALPTPPLLPAMLPPLAMQVDHTPSSSAIVDPTMRIKDESVSSFPTQSRNGLEHTDTEIIGDVSASGVQYSGFQSSLMLARHQLNRDLVDEVWAKDTDSDTGTENLIGCGCAYTSFSIAFSISPTSSTSISQAPPSLPAPPNWMIHLHLLLQFQALQDLQQLPILNSLQRRPLAFCTTIVVLPSKPVSSVKRWASKSPDTTPLFKRAASSALEGELDDSKDSVPPPKTGLPNIPVLWSERDAAAELPKNHNPRGMNGEFQASCTNYILGFSGVLHHNSKHKYGAGDVHPRKRQDIVETTKGCASSLISSSVSPHVLWIDHSDPLNVADSSLRTYTMLDLESIS
ncbi:hypothetical protein F5879DRAFT_1047077 [Lentinula edodes]|nr:hypothetical protein F5879DRAFT_1047077 [Lentinula edodes]